ncbi:MAG: T9SS type A sorting domain-containing protein [Bacteroidetes bacterium]|nr:T9SS type A sorting domain-containing protein [Bacteroidota bacterium]
MQGDTIWSTLLDSAQYPSTGNVKSVIQLKQSNNYLICLSYAILSLDENGHFLWSKSYEIYPDTVCIFNGMEEYGTDSILISGYYFDTPHAKALPAIFFADTSGNISSSRTFDSVDTFTEMERTMDKGYLLVLGKYEIVKLDSSANLLWSVSCNTNSWKSYGIRKIVEGPDSSIYGVDAQFNNFYRESDDLFKLDKNGYFLWAARDDVNIGTSTFITSIFNVDTSKLLVTGSLDYYNQFSMMVDTAGDPISANYSPAPSKYSWTSTGLNTGDGYYWIFMTEQMFKHDSTGVSCSTVPLSPFRTSIYGSSLRTTLTMINGSTPTLAVSHLPVINHVIPVSTECLSVSIEEQFKETQAQIFPNPTSEYLNIVCKEIPESIEIYTLDGKQLSRTIGSMNEETLDLRRLLPAAYMIVIHCREHITTKLFVKE